MYAQIAHDRGMAFCILLFAFAEIKVFKVLFLVFNANNCLFIATETSNAALGSL